ncbi:bacteriocin immunity protein [Companilactobacillus zhongbaensis]|uniref:bacteriocin immunity protein n=1 Tax=Companilactobacillus zhongbaensis TaxID=2486009 RepID=UPI000F76F8AB|nr:bacteriocin immunity protein [Companilactobacillus zhongbaensis]
MAKQKSVETLMDQLSAAYGDSEVKKYPDLQKLILNSATELEKRQDVDLISSKLSKQMTLYHMDHSKEFPKAAVELFNQISTRAMRYDGTAAAAILLPLWF